MPSPAVTASRSTSYHCDVALALIEPTVDLYEAWLDAHRDWGPGVHEDGFGLDARDEVGSPKGFAAWVARLRAESDRGTCRWIVEDGRVQGGIALRHRLNERTGHIGYGIRPSARGRGLATWALGQMLCQAQVLTIDRVLVVCASQNLASAKTIEKTAASSTKSETPSTAPYDGIGSTSARACLLIRGARW
jgi:predicted acetyltransferase